MISRKIFQFCSKKQNFLVQNFHKKQVYFFATATSSRKSCPYKTLNVSTDATAEEIKKSYLELAKKYHPDVQTGETVQAGKFLEISEAYQLLFDPEKRHQYDYENGIISGKKRSSTTKASYKKEGPFATWDTTKESEMSEKEKEELDNYFQKKYFQNKDYFKLKVDETNPWNLTRKLYNQAEDKKEKMEQDYVHFRPFPTESYYVHKDELKYYEKYPVFLTVIYDYRYLILGGVFLAFIFSMGNLYLQTDNKGKAPQKNMLNQPR